MLCDESLTHGKIREVYWAMRKGIEVGEIGDDWSEE
jgi:hypothetical protein